MEQLSSSSPGSANLDSWNRNAQHWDEGMGETGNDLFALLIIPSVRNLVGELHPGARVLDLGTGNGMLARNLAQEGVTVVATDYSESQLQYAENRATTAGKHIEWRRLDLLKSEELNKFAREHEGEDRFDAVVGSMLLKELSDIDPLATFLTKILKSHGSAIFVNLHPCFHKPAAHRVMEVLENPDTGNQEKHHWIKVSRYLSIPTARSRALRHSPDTLTWFHRPIHELLNPFAKAGLVLRGIHEPSFDDELNDKEIQNYHNYPQIPMLFNFKFSKGT